MKMLNKQQGFTLTELIIAVAIIGILSAIAIPSYNSSVVKGSRSAAQTELTQFAALQEKIYLNSNSYASSVSAAYTGQSSGGLGSTGNSKDGKYSYACNNCIATYYQIAATPVAGKGQAIANDGTLTIDSMGVKQWTNGAGVTTNW